MCMFVLQSTLVRSNLAVLRSITEYLQVGTRHALRDTACHFAEARHGFADSTCRITAKTINMSLDEANAVLGGDAIVRFSAHDPTDVASQWRRRTGS